MILDKLENAGQYAGLHQGIDMLLEKLKTLDPDTYTPEREELDGKNVFMFGTTYETKDPANVRMEAHRAYVDVMYMLRGAETVYVKPVMELQNITDDYDPEKDCLLAAPQGGATAVRLEAGSFLVLFPQDAHAPACHSEEPGTVLKIIGKARLIRE